MSTQDHLEACLASLTTSNALLDSSVSLLRTSTDDFPRVSTVLHQNKVFTMVPEVDMIRTSNDLKNKIEPQIESILIKIDADLEKLQTRRQTLLQNTDLQNMRLETFNKLNKIEHNELEIVGEELDLQRLKFLKSKKERLKFSLDRLSLQGEKRRLSMLP